MTNNSKILLVDDEPGMLASSKALLETADYEVVIAQGGKAAIEKLEQDEFDLVLLDMNMPEVNGHMVMEFINDKLIKVAVVVLSGDFDFNSVARAFQLGAFDYIKKPFEFDELQHTLKNALRKQEVEKSLYTLRKQLERSERLHRFMV